MKNQWPWCSIATAASFGAILLDADVEQAPGDRRPVEDDAIGPQGLGDQPPADVLLGHVTPFDRNVSMPRRVRVRMSTESGRLG